MENSFIVGVASETLKEEEPLVFDALCEGIKKGMEYIAENPEETAEMLCQLDGNTPEDELKYLQLGSYTAETSGLFDMASFMAENNFIESAPSAYEDLVFDNVEGN